jgi:hypothetical protein
MRDARSDATITSKAMLLCMTKHSTGEMTPRSSLDRTHEAENTKMTGPRPAGRPWTLTDDDMLLKLLVSGMKPRLIAQKMKCSIGAVQSRIYLLKKPRKRQEGK